MIKKISAGSLGLGALVFALTACGGSSVSTSADALRTLQQAGYQCEDPATDTDSLGCMRPTGEAGWWEMSIVGSGHEYSNLGDYVKNEWGCSPDDLTKSAIFGENWIVVDGGGSEDAYLTKDLGGSIGTLADLCG